MEPNRHMMKVVSPVEGKNGKTFWLRVGVAFRNRDGSINVYIDAFPTSGKLQLRELDERDRQGRDARDASDSAAIRVDNSRLPQDQLPF